MRTLWVAVIVGICLVAGVSCGVSKPPSGRWEGTYETAHTMIVARLEIDKGSAIYISAPDMLDIATSDEDARDVIRQRLAANLAEDWASVEARKMSFDGRVFRKPGGIAPQLEWDPDTKAMTMVAYFGTRPAIHVPLHAVKDFSPNPWPAAQM